MRPSVSFQQIVEEEVLRQDKAVFAGIGQDIEEAMTREQSQDIRSSDAGSCSLELWAKLNGMLTLPPDPQQVIFRMNMGTLVGSLLGRYYQAGAERRGIQCVVEKTVTFEGITGHMDIVLPELRHIYEIKSNYGTRIYEPARYQKLQTGIYHNAEGEEYTSSVIIAQPALGTGRNRIREYAMNDPEYLAEAKAESLRLRKIAAAITPPTPDVNPEEKFRCSSCRYGICANNTNPALKKEVAV